MAFGLSLPRIFVILTSRLRQVQDLEIPPNEGIISRIETSPIWWSPICSLANRRTLSI